MKILKIFFAMIIVFSFFSLYGCGGKGGSSTPASYFPYITPDDNSNTNSSNTNSSNTNNSNNTSKKPWLFLTYFVADNDDIAIIQLMQLKELEYVGSDDNTNILAFIDIGNAKNNIKDLSNYYKIDWIGGRNYYIQKNDSVDSFHSEVIADYGNLDSADKNFFYKWLKESITKYPADNICLVLNSHGGAYQGLLYDRGENTYMTNTDVADAIKKVEEETGSRINVLTLDACLMSNIESLYEYKDSTDYIIASEDVSYSGAINYEHVLNNSASKSAKSISSKPAIIPQAIKTIQNIYTANVESNLKISSNVTPKDLAQIIFDTIEKDKSFYLTCSLIDTSKLENLKEAVLSFSQAVLNTQNTENLLSDMFFGSDENMTFEYRMEESEEEGIYYSIYYIYDLYDIMNNIILSKSVTYLDIKESAKKVQEAIEEAVIDNINFAFDSDNKYSNSHGISIFLSSPDYLIYYYDDVKDDSTLENYKKLKFVNDSKWYDMLAKLYL